MSIQDLIQLINTQLPDNNQQLITEAVLRGVLESMTNTLSSELRLYNIESGDVTDNGDGTYTLSVQNELPGAIAIDEQLNIYQYDGAAWTLKVDATMFATAAQGAKADTAIQPGDNVSGLNNDAGYLTETTHDNLPQDNPHGVTASQVGLGNVDNTSDADKPVSIAQGLAINQAEANAKQYTDDEISNLNLGTASQADVGDFIASTEKGAPGGVAELDGSGHVPSSQLPSYVDDVVEVANYASLPVTGESGKIYITIDDNLTYRWSGSAYVEISSSLALGETSSTAYRGDRGKIAYDHSQVTSGNPHGVTGDEVINNLSPNQIVFGDADGTIKQEVGFEWNGQALSLGTGDNVAIGRDTHQDLHDTGNVMVGPRAGRLSVGDGYNTFVGGYAGYKSTNVYRCTAIGYGSLRGSPATRSIAIGYNAEFQGTAGSGVITIGDGQKATRNNQVKIGSQNHHWNIEGDVGIKTDTPSQPIDVNGNARIRGHIYDSNNVNGSGLTSAMLSVGPNGIEWKELPVSGVEEFYPVYISYDPSGYSGEDLIMVYVRRGLSNNYVGHWLVHDYNMGELAYKDIYRIRQAQEFKYVGGTMVLEDEYAIMGGESECVIKDQRTGKVDFTGGVHGDEIYQTFQLFLDGKPVDLSSAFGLTPAKEVYYIQKSTLHETADDIGGVPTPVPGHPVIATHFKKTYFGDSGYTTYNDLVWEESFELFWYHGISCIGKIQATNVFDEEFTTTPMTFTNTQTPMIGKLVEFYNETTKLGATVTATFTSETVSDEDCEVFIWDRENDSKYYRTTGVYTSVIGKKDRSVMEVKYKAALS